MYDRRCWKCDHLSSALCALVSLNAWPYSPTFSTHSTWNMHTYMTTSGEVCFSIQSPGLFSQYISLVKIQWFTWTMFGNIIHEFALNMWLVRSWMRSINTHMMNRSAESLISLVIVIEMMKYLFAFWLLLLTNYGLVELIFNRQFD